MARVLFFFALLIAAVSAFTAPVQRSAIARPAFVAPKMTPIEVVSEAATFIDNSNLIASSSADNGGLFWPIVGLGGLAAIILGLSPPLKDPN